MSGVESPRALPWWPPHRYALSVYLLIFCFALVLRLNIASPTGRTLNPQPDAHEYAETARRIAFGQGFGLSLAGDVFPSRYPVLFPLLFAPAVWLTGADAIQYARIMSILGSLSAALAAAAAFSLLRSRLAAFVAGAIFCFSGTHIWWSHFLMSDLPVLLFYQILFLIALTKTMEASRLWLSPFTPPAVVPLSAGLLCGFLPGIRLSALPLAAAAAIFFALSWKRHPRALILFALTAAVGPAIEIANRIVSFGTILGNGYLFWLPFHRPDAQFSPISLRWLIESSYGQERGINILYYARALTGLDPALVGWPIALPILVIGGAWVLRRRFLVMPQFVPIIWFLVVGPLGLFALHCLYYFHQQRFLLPLLLPVAIAIAAVAHHLRSFALPIPRSLLKWRAVSVALALAILSFPAYHAVAAMRFARFEDLTPYEIRLLQRAHPDLVITNLGTLRMQNLLYRGRALATAPDHVIALSDIGPHDEHIFRGTRLAPMYRQATAPQNPLILARWDDPVMGATALSELDLVAYPITNDPGAATLQQPTIQRVRNEIAAHRRVILLIKPDREARKILDLCRAAGWNLEIVSNNGRVETWRVASVDQPATGP